ncbi:MAG: ABC transporter ATP-binding protein [Peptococcaceae bacterium]|jgi:ABC-2 type transport system ATP-binding protein|nr:ABC transporter ATP-binding protein [Peptococcaceae bacterium]
MLKIERIVKTYGGKRAVDGLSLRIRPGEICGFIGHNGAGKTTTIKLVCGILEFDSGEITVGGHSVKTEPLACKRQIAYIPDNPDLYDFVSGIKYLNFIADVYGVDAETRGERIREYAGLFELTDDLSGLVSSYSHGMKQKLALVSALIHDPKLYILDEPFVGLDPKAARTVKDIMRAKCDAGCSVFFSTHILEVAERLCDQIAIIKNGKLVASGETERILGDSSLEDVFFELEEGKI